MPDRGVSPVVGVLLMVAVTVLLAGTVGAFLFQSAQSATADRPNAGFSMVKQPDGDVVVRMDGGETLQASNLVVKVDGSPATYEQGWPSRITAGTEAEIDQPGTGSTVTVVYQSPASDTTYLLAEWEVPR